MELSDGTQTFLQQNGINITSSTPSLEVGNNTLFPGENSVFTLRYLSVAMESQSDQLNFSQPLPQNGWPSWTLIFYKLYFVFAIFIYLFWLSIDCHTIHKMSLKGVSPDIVSRLQAKFRASEFPGWEKLR